MTFFFATLKIIVLLVNLKVQDYPKHQAMVRIIFFVDIQANCEHNSNLAWRWTHIMKIKESDLAVSIIQDGENELSNLEVFNISKNYNRIYAMGEVYGSYYFFVVVASLLNIKLSLKKKPAWVTFHTIQEGGCFQLYAFKIVLHTIFLN